MMKRKFYFFLKLLFVFAILFDINFKFLPSITTSRIALILLISVALVRRNKLPISLLYYLFILIIILGLSVMQSLYSGEFTQSSRIIWFSLYSIIVPFLLTNYIKDRNEFFSLVSVAVLIQAVLTICSYLMPPVKTVFTSLILYTSNFDETNLLRAMGFASVGGASFSVIQSTGVISLLIINRLNNLNFFNKVLLWSSIILIVISIFFIGRTGLFMSMLAILIYFLSLRFKLKNIAIFLIFLFSAFQINYVNLIDNLTSNIEGFKSELFIDWIESAFQLKGNETADALNEMPVPPISFDTIIGTGRVFDNFGNASGHDSGYIQTYYALGLFLAVFFYFTFFLFLIFQIKIQKQYKVPYQKILYLLVFIIFVIEFKEPFIFSYSFPFFVLTSILVFHKLVQGEKMVLNSSSIYNR